MFVPTYLYVKQHALTGMMYFGKTVQNPIAYRGSGKHWLRHIKKHGAEHVLTKWHRLFTNMDECVEFAIFFSDEADIVKSPNWANLMPENGLFGGNGGANKGIKKPPASAQHRAKLSATLKGRSGISPSLETREKIRASLKGRPSPKKGKPSNGKGMTGKKQSPESIARRTETRRLNGWDHRCK